MPKLSPATVLDRTLSRLMQKRQHHATALAEIDALFAKYGITVNGNVAPAKRGPGRPPKATAGTSATQGTAGKVRGRRRRGSFSRTAEEMILSILPASTSEINAAWAKEGRGGKADNTLSLMAKKKVIKRTKNKEGRGSTYARN